MCRSLMVYLENSQWVGFRQEGGVVPVDPDLQGSAAGQVVAPPAQAEDDADGGRNAK